MNVALQNSHTEVLCSEALVKSNDVCYNESIHEHNKIGEASITENDTASPYHETSVSEEIAAASASAPVESIDPLELEVNRLAEARLQGSTEETLDEARIAVKRQLTETVFQRLHIVDRESAKQEYGVRFNAIHVLGVNHMSTDQIREYFSAYPPAHVEWLDDKHANVVWKNDASALRALIYMTLPDALGVDPKSSTKVKQVEAKDDTFGYNSCEEDGVLRKDFEREDVVELGCKEDNDDFDVIKEDKLIILSGDSEEEKRTPEGFWLLGRPYFRSRALFLRYATRFDRKQRGSDRRSEYYRRHGNPNFFGMTGIISHSYRQLLRGNDPRAVRVAKFKDPDDFIGKRWSGYDVSQDQRGGDHALKGGATAAASSEEDEELDAVKGRGEEELDHEKELDMLLGKRTQLVSMKLVSDEMEEKDLVKGAHHRLGAGNDTVTSCTGVNNSKSAAQSQRKKGSNAFQQQSGEIRAWDLGKEAVYLPRKRKRTRTHGSTDCEENVVDEEDERDSRAANVHLRLGPRVNTSKSRRVELKEEEKEVASSERLQSKSSLVHVRQLELITSVKAEPVDVDVDLLEKSTVDKTDSVRRQSTTSSSRRPSHLMRKSSRRSPLKKIARNVDRHVRSTDRRRSDHDLEAAQKRSRAHNLVDHRRYEFDRRQEHRRSYGMDYRRDLRPSEADFTRISSTSTRRQEVCQKHHESDRIRRREAQNIPKPHLVKKDGRQGYGSRFSRHDRSEVVERRGGRGDTSSFRVRTDSRGRVPHDRPHHERPRRSKSPTFLRNSQHPHAHRTTSSLRYKTAAAAAQSATNPTGDIDHAAHFYSTWIRGSRSRSNLSSVSSSITSTSSSSSSSSSITSSSNDEFSDENDLDTKNLDTTMPS